jgi:hypothetical protein
MLGVGVDGTGRKRPAHVGYDFDLAGFRWGSWIVWMINGMINAHSIWGRTVTAWHVVRATQARRRRHIPELSVATVNGNWMNDWLPRRRTGRATSSHFSRDDHVQHRRGHLVLGQATHAIDANTVALVEAPSGPAEFELFISRYLSPNGMPESLPHPGRFNQCVSKLLCSEVPKATAA